ncbi:hypothetical protein GW950_01470 [Candidatus Wolfebacteria bacterium]|nr:hypothetical protein [Candidatus Wolfebacteria bacterium]
MGFEKLREEKSKIDDPVFLDRIRNEFANGLDDLFTDPNFRFGFSVEDAEKVRMGEKIPSGTMIRGVLFKIAQDNRLNPYDIDRLEKIFLESAD